MNYHVANRVYNLVKIMKLPASTAGLEFIVTASNSFTRGVEGITRKNESILFMLLSLLFTGTESERDIRRWTPLVCKNEQLKITDA